MGKVSFLAEAESEVVKSITDFASKYGKSFTDILEEALTDYVKNPAKTASLNEVQKLAVEFLGDLRTPVVDSLSDSVPLTPVSNA